MGWSVIAKRLAVFENSTHGVASPVGDGGAGDVVEGGGVSVVEPAAAGVLDGLERFWSLNRSPDKIGQSYIAAHVAVDMCVVERECADGNGRP